MPRRVKTSSTQIYLVPSGTEEKTIAIIEENPSFYNHKHKENWRQKFLYLVQNISNMLLDEGLNPCKDYINVNQDYSQEILGVDNTTISAIFKHLLRYDVLECDDKMIVAQKRIGKGGHKQYLSEGKSYGYRFKTFRSLVDVEVLDRKGQANRIEKVHLNSFNSSPAMGSYYQALKSVTVDLDLLDEKITSILNSKEQKRNKSQEYETLLMSLQEEHRTNTRKLSGCKFSKSPKIYRYPPVYRDHVISPSFYNLPPTSIYIYTTISIEDMIVPCEPCRFEIVRKKKRNKKTDDHGSDIEDDQTSINRIRHAVSKINDGSQVPNRPRRNSRVYTEVTRLNRELRGLLRINGNPIIGLDIRNSQPLLASILIEEYWKNIGSGIPADVVNYRHACEAGTFYDYFMELNGIPDHMRSEFKADFFRRVFFSMVTNESHILKTQFIDRYPKCWEAICTEKGGLFSRNYPRFAKNLQTVEAQIMFDGVNAGLLEMGIISLNIFDSIYVGSIEEYQVAEHLVKEEFAKYGIHPTINPEFYG